MFKFLGKVFMVIIIGIFAIVGIYLVGIIATDIVHKDDVVETWTSQEEFDDESIDKDVIASKDNIIKTASDKGGTFFVEYKNVSYEQFKEYVAMAKAAGYVDPNSEYSVNTERYAQIYQYTSARNTNRYMLLNIMYTPMDEILNISISDFSQQ